MASRSNEPLTRTALLRLVPFLLITLLGSTAAVGQQSVARQWNEQMLEAVRNDFARPTVHARNLFHVSVAMWDAWAAYDATADGFLNLEFATAPNIQAAREEAISHAAYRVLRARFSKSPGSAETIPALDALMDALGYDKNFTATVGSTPAALGNRIAVDVLAFGFTDGANVQGGYVNLYYEPVNPPLVPALPGNPDIIDPNLWQPLALEFFIDQGGNVILGGFPEFLSPEWGIVKPFSLTADDLTIYPRDGFDYWVYHDPGPPPDLGGVGDDYYKSGFEMVSLWSSHLDPSDGVMWDISPASIGNSPLPAAGDYAAFFDEINGGDWGTGHGFNPSTGQPYAPQIVARGDYCRILAEFWADGPDSETPPGHWFVLLNYVTDQLAEKRLGGTGPILDDLEWDVKTYLAMGGAMHDVAITAWGIKGWYDYVRPVSAIRYMADRGQSSDPKGPSYHVDGINLYPGLIELVTSATTAAGERHEHLAAAEGKIALKAWRGPDYINNPDTDTADVGWILAEDWWPYQRPTFVTPPFAGYVSGHSTYSRAAAELMTLMTGSKYFPSGLGEFFCPQNEFLVFEDGPSMDVTLQWATYRDASDQCSLSRIWGGIHPPADDLPGRILGEVIGPDAYDLALKYFNGEILFGDVNCDGAVDLLDATTMVHILLDEDNIPCHLAKADMNQDGNRNGLDVAELVAALVD